MVPSREQIEDYLNELDEWAWKSLQAAAADIPSLHSVANRIWADLGRFGPPNIQIPGLGVFDVPPTPPPPPDPTWLENTGNWIVGHRWKALGLGLCFVVGSGLLAGYASSKLRRAKVQARSRRSSKKRERKEVAVVLGADCVVGIQLVLELESRGFIVIAAVSSSEAVQDLESDGNGYVRALVLDPTEPTSVTSFTRSLQTTLSLRFPTSVAGDPYYSSPSLHPHICTVISLLSLQDPPPPTPFEHLSLSTTYLPYLQRSHITPLHAIQNLLPMMRVPANSNTSSVNKHKKRIIICLPVIASRVGVSWSSAQAMSAGATLKAVDVLRRELRDSGQGSSISVTVADVGAVGSYSSDSSYNTGAAAYMTDWSSNTRFTYGPAFLGALEHSRTHPRQSENIREVVEELASLADEQRLVFGIDYLFDWKSCERVGMGAGAYTYTLASQLPERLLDGLLSIPAQLVHLQNKLAPSQSEKPLDEEEKEEEDAEEEDADVDVVEEQPAQSAKATPGSSGYSSEAELLSLNSSDRIGSSWVSLNEQQE